MLMLILLGQKLGDKEFKVVKEIYGSSIPVAAEETEIAILRKIFYI